MASSGHESAGTERRRGDRRRRPTPPVSRHWLAGRRRAGRRAGDAGGYVDRPRARSWILALAILALSVVDLVWTLEILEHGGEEANPVMAWTLDRGRGTFVGVKLGITAVGVVFLVIHERFRMTRWWLEIIFGLYGVLIVYHVWLRGLLPV